MSFTRLSESVQTLYAELLDQLRAADAQMPVGGTFVSKTINGRSYWYLQRSEGATKRQIYVGPETPELLAQITAAKESRADDSVRRELVTMLDAGGMHREAAAMGTVLRVLADAGVFRGGDVLLGTGAFACLANLLGVRFESESLRTADVDIGHDPTVAVATRRKEGDLLEYGLDVRQPSTSFRVRGRDLRVDFLTSTRGGKRKPALLPHLGVSAQPLEGLGYVLTGAIDAAVISGNGIYVRVPDPARFALHKLWVASQRSASEAAKSRKDIRQAEQLLEVLRADRPGDVRSAHRALSPSMARRVNARLKALGHSL